MIQNRYLPEDLTWSNASISGGGSFVIMIGNGGLTHFYNGLGNPPSPIIYSLFENKY